MYNINRNVKNNNKTYLENLCLSFSFNGRNVEGANLKEN